MTRLHFVKKARKKNPAVKKGESYYWWQFRYGPKRYSKEKPRRSQLTQSDFLSQLYELEDEIAEAAPESPEDLESLRDEWVQRIEDLRDECQEKLDNMPEQLQESDSGQLLQERIDALEEWSNAIGGIDVDYDEDEAKKMFAEGKLEEIQQTSSGL